jgi:hypothetical protein
MLTAMTMKKMTLTELHSIVDDGEQQLGKLVDALDDVRTQIGTILNGHKDEPKVALKVVVEPKPKRPYVRKRKKCSGPGNRLLTQKQAKSIRAHYKTGNWTHDALATKFKCSQFTVAQVIHRVGAYS